MVIEIALGIVLAVIILAFLPLIFAVAGVAVLLGIAAAVIALLVWNFQEVAAVIAIVAGLGIAVLVPYLLYGAAVKKWPGLVPIIDGKAPYDNWRRIPFRVACTAGIVIPLVLVGFLITACFAGAATYVEHWFERSSTVSKSVGVVGQIQPS